MRTLTVDIGNTNTRFAIFEEDELIDVKKASDFVDDGLMEWLKENRVGYAIISSVGADPGELASKFGGAIKLVEFNTGIMAGLNSLYETPATLGQDRWAKMIAVSNANRGQTSVVLDAGTCLTVDLLVDGQTYKGGTISPGIQMRFKALKEFTGKLPFVCWNNEDGVPEGLSTDNAIISGVVNGFVYEVEGILKQYNTDHKGLKVFLTGGDAGLLWSRLKNSIFAPQIISDPLLVFKGLNEVIKLEKCS